ncbi:MAG: DUF2911 domain-containing protein [Terriglobales bacterium]
MFKPVAIVTLFILALTAFAGAQKQRPSPAEQAQCKFSDGKTITVDYSSPRMKGRKIFGDLVPYGEVWRTGANDATTFVTTANVTVGGKSVPAGSYTIFTVPNQGNWTLIVNKKTGEWGIPYKYEGDELVRVDMKVSQTPSPVENFTIAFDQACTLTLSWENTQASVKISGGK